MIIKIALRPKNMSHLTSEAQERAMKQVRQSVEDGSAEIAFWVPEIGRIVFDASLIGIE